MGDIEHDGFKVTRRPEYAPKGYKGLSPLQSFDDSYAGSGVPLREHPSFKRRRPIKTFAEDPDRCAACESNATLCIYYSHALGVGYDSYAFYELECQDCGLFTSHGHSTDGCSGY